MAKHVSDFSKTSDQIVIDLINDQNGTNFTADSIEFSDVEGEGKVTRILVSAKRGGGYYGSQSVIYNRLLLSEIPDSVTTDEFEFDMENFSDVLKFVNMAFEVNINPEDATVNGFDLETMDPVVDQEYDVVQNYQIVAKETSLVWLGQLSFNLTKVRTELSDIWQITDLEGLYSPINWPNTPMFIDTDGDMRQRADGSFRQLL